MVTERSRGSWSQFVGSWDLYRAGGRATKTNETHSLASRSHDRAARLATKQSLQRPPVRFSETQIQAVGRGFARYVELSGLPVWACAVMPDHVHLVTGRFRLQIEDVVVKLKSAATQRLVEESVHPFQHLKPADGPPPKCFAQGEWKVFLDPEDVERAIRYVERNPVNEGLSRQTWPFVTRPG